MPGIDFNKNLMCETTGWHNNCGVNCLAHFLVAKLQNGELEVIFSNDPAYDALRKTFAEYYNLPNTPSWEDIKDFLNDFPAATDHEAILAPVLRKHLGNILASKADDLWKTEAAAAISDFVEKGEKKDVALPIYNANQQWFEDLRAKYHARLSSLPKEFSDDENALAYQQLGDRIAGLSEDQIEAKILEQIAFQRKNKVLEDLMNDAEKEWKNTACLRYANYMGDLRNSAMVSAGQLDLICKELKIDLAVYGPEMRLISDGDNFWNLKVYNAGAHWEFESPDENSYYVIKHNAYYVEESHPKAQFNIRKEGADSSALQEAIKDRVKKGLTKISAVERDFLLGDLPKKSVGKFVYTQEITDSDHPDFKHARDANIVERERRQNLAIIDRNSSNFTQLEADIYRDYQICFPGHVGKYIDIEGTRYTLEGPMKQIVPHITDAKKLREVVTFLASRNGNDPIFKEKVLGISQGHVSTAILLANNQFRFNGEHFDLGFTIHSKKAAIMSYPDGTTKLTCGFCSYTIIGIDGKIHIKDAKSGKELEFDQSMFPTFKEAADAQKIEIISGKNPNIKVKYTDEEGQEKELELEPMLSFAQTIEYTPSKDGKYQEDKVSVEIYSHTKSLQCVDPALGFAPPIPQAQPQAVPEISLGRRILNAIKDFFIAIGRGIANLFKKKEAQAAPDTEIFHDAVDTHAFGERLNAAKEDFDVSPGKEVAADEKGPTMEPVVKPQVGLTVSPLAKKDQSVKAGQVGFLPFKQAQTDFFSLAYASKLNEKYPQEEWSCETQTNAQAYKNIKDPEKQFFIEKSSTGMKFSGTPEALPEVIAAAMGYKQDLKETLQKTNPNAIAVMNVNAKDEIEAVDFLISLKREGFNIRNISAIHCKQDDPTMSAQDLCKKLIERAENKAAETPKPTKGLLNP